jgi:Hint domain
MPHWLALSDRDAPDGAMPGPLERGLFVLEYRLAQDSPAVLVDLQAGAGQTVSVFHDPIAGPSILIRQDGRMRRHLLRDPLPETATGTARLTLWVDLPANHWRMSLDLLDSGLRLDSHGTDPLPLDVAAFRVMADKMASGHRDSAVLWFGLTAGAELPRAAPWIGLRTPIDTERGAVPAGLLRHGDRIRTLDQGFLPLLAVQRMTLPACGSFAPVVLRQPFFGGNTDLLVSADQLVLISGASVEYLTGEEEALIPAGALADGRVALRDNRRPVTDCLALDLGEPALILADGCCLLSLPTGPSRARLPRRALQDWEMPPLLALLGRTSLRPAA